MEEKSRGISLRKKRSVRPQISAPKQISAPLPQGSLATSTLSSQNNGLLRPDAAGSSLEVPGSRERSAKTADLVKRRYSTRFTQLPTDFNAEAPPMPGVPAIPSQYAKAASSSARPSTSGDGQKIKVDIRALRDPNLLPEQYVASLLADASEQDIMDYQQELRKVKNRTSTDLQHNVYQNRTQFIKISKEAEKLKGEMRTLRTLMADLTSALGQTTSAAGVSGDTLTARKQANRSSVANLEALWNTHLQMLWKRVEGSQKFLPAVPGRHIVYESGRWVELNAATWKARRRVHLILLNDHLLVAAEKKRGDPAAQNKKESRQKQSQAQVHLVAQRCWPLQDVHMADLSTRSAPPRDGAKPGSVNAVNLRVGAESFTFATGGSDSTEKLTLLAAFRKAAEDLRKAQEAEIEERGKAQDSVNYFASRDSGMLKKTDLLESLSENAANNRSSIFVDVDGKQQNIRWVESQLDELDIDIALHHFEEAVARVERLKRIGKGIKGNHIAQEIITFKVNERASKLASVIVQQLVATASWMTSTRKHVDWLMRLGAEDQARDAYLETRSELVHKRTRQCLFDGDLHQYIYQISFIYFTIIKNTVQIYSNCFPPPMMSACVKWAKGHVDDFNQILARQLSSVDKESAAWRECMDRAHAHAAMLADVGLDFRAIIGQGIEAQGEQNGSKAIGLGLTEG